MTTTPGNPFVFPGMGLGATPDGSAGNPVLQSLEMMRQAWSQMGGANPFAGALPSTPILNTEELDKRIQELQAVANWLRLNMNMLQGTIQALEVQRATIATLRSFAQNMGNAAGGGSASGEPSPLEVALGIKPHTRTGQTPPAEPAPPPQAAAPEAPAAPPPADKPADAAQPQQAWWNLLQNQFNQIAQAAAASIPAAAPRPTPPAPAARSRAASAATATKPAAKARKTAPRKAAARKRSGA